MKTMKIAALAGLVAVSAAAYATVTFDTTSGVGFIGRGDVITYVGKAGLMNNPLVVFQDHMTLTQTCEKTIETGKTIKVLTHEMTRTRNVNATVQVGARTAPGNDNITGYMLTGFSAGGVAPMPTDLCANPFYNNDPSGWTATGPVVQTGSTGGVLTFNGVVIPF